MRILKSPARSPAKSGIFQAKLLQSIFNSRLSIHLIIRHSIYPVGIITRYKLCATTDSQKVELTMKTPLITREGYEKLKQEMDYLWRQERPEVTKR